MFLFESECLESLEKGFGYFLEIAAKLLGCSSVFWEKRGKGRGGMSDALIVYGEMVMMIFGRNGEACTNDIVKKILRRTRRGFPLKTL